MYHSPRMRASDKHTGSLPGRLVLTRNIGEEIVISLPTGGKIVVGVVRADFGRARLTFAAPADVRIMRTELVGGG